MKKISILFLLMFSIISYSQSISASRILYFASSQNIDAIIKELKQLGFKTRTDNSEGYTIYQFLKKTRRGVEQVEMGKNTELFMFTYKPEYSVYSILKGKILTSDFKYSYSYKNTKYYENGKTRIGDDETKGIISVFKPLK